MATRTPTLAPDRIEAHRTAPPRFRPVVLWAGTGAAFLLLQLYIYGAWLTSGDLRPTPSGPDSPPTWMQFALQAVLAVEFAGLVAFVWFVVVQPWRRDRRLPLDGYFALACLSVYWQDMLMNYSQNWITQNATMPLQWGSWNAEIPGWLAPKGERIVESVAMIGPVYLYVLAGGMILGCWAMRKAQQRWPQLGTVGLLAVGYGFFVLVDFVTEMSGARLGLFAYPGAIRSVSLFAGKHYQFPLYEPFAFAVTLALMAGVRYFKNDKGQTVAERGIDELRLRPKGRGVVRGLAFVGIINALYLFTYMVPVQWFALHADPWPEDILRRSYFTNQLCGPGTTYRCPGPDTPIPRVDSDHVAPDGRLVTNR